MNVNTYKAIGFLITFLPEPVGDYMKAAQEHLRDLADAYNALAPDWANAPDDARWYTIDANGEAVWCREEPTVKEHWVAMWGPITVRLHNAPIVELPLGIDWRLCKWSREGAK